MQAFFQSAQHLYEKREGSGAGSDLDPDPYLWLMDPDPGGPKTCGSVSPTLLSSDCMVSVLMGRTRHKLPGSEVMLVAFKYIYLVTFFSGLTR